MIDLILFMLVITLTTIFIFIVAPILSKKITENDIEEIEAIIGNIVLFIEQTKADTSNEEKKQLATEYAKRILSFMDIKISDELLNVIIEAQVFLLKNRGLGNF